MQVLTIKTARKAKNKNYASRQKKMRLLKIISTISLSFVPALAGTQVASADQIAVAKAQASSIAQRISSLNNQVAMYAEQYDQAQLQLQSLNTQMHVQQQKILQTQSSIVSLKHKLAVEAVNFYTEGGAVVSFSDLITGTSTDVTLRKVFAGTVANSQQTLISQFQAATTTLRRQTQALQVQQAQVTSTLTSAAQSKKDAQVATDQAQSQLNSVNSSIAVLVQQAQQQAALAAQRRAQQLVLAQQQAALAAQQQASAAAQNVQSTQTSTLAVQTSPIPVGAGAGEAVALAMQEVGKPYVFGAEGPNAFDCSGLTAYVWGHAGVPLPHSAAAQYDSIAHIPLTALQPGDLIFYYTPIDHVAIYIGGGQVVVADNPSYPVAVRSVYWDGVPVGAGRP